MSSDVTTVECLTCPRCGFGPVQEPRPGRWQCPQCEARGRVQLVEDHEGKCLSFVVPGPPVSWLRTRVSTKDGEIRFFTHPKTMRYENYVAWLAHQAKLEQGWELAKGPVELHMVFVLKRPNYMCRRSKRTGELLGGYHEGRYPCDKKRSDLDRLESAIMDALKQAGVYEDDCQVWRKPDVQKVYAALDEEPHVEVTVWQTQWRQG